MKMIEIPENDYKAAHLPPSTQLPASPDASRPTPPRRSFMGTAVALGSALFFAYTILGTQSQRTAIAASQELTAQEIKTRKGSEVRLRAPMTERSSLSRNATFDKPAVVEKAVAIERSNLPVELGTRSDLPAVNLVRTANGRVRLQSLPSLQGSVKGRSVSLGQQQEVILYSIDPALQQYTQELVRKAAAPHVAVVAMEPNTGRILAIADKSISIPQLSLHAGFPAASLFKIVTAAAAVEHAGVNPLQMVKFRGGTYTLDRWNYLPGRNDKRTMSLSEALGRSCNPVFGRVALSYLNPTVLRRYAEAFGYNEDLGFDLAIPRSTASIPEGDEYELSRTGAGFGAVTLSPVHAAAFMSGVANGGNLVRPHLIDQVVSKDGSVIYKAKPEIVQQMVRPETSRRLLEMMKYTITVGTSRKEFAKRRGTPLASMDVAAKTGTLRGENPEGINHWFVATAPVERPQIAVAVISIDPTKDNGKASYLGRMVMERYFSR